LRLVLIDVTRVSVSLGSTSRSRSTGREVGEFCGPRTFTGPGKHCGYGKPNFVVVWFLKLRFPPMGRRTWCLPGGGNLGVSVGDARGEVFRGAGRLLFV